MDFLDEGGHFDLVLLSILLIFWIFLPILIHIVHKGILKTNRVTVISVDWPRPFIYTQKRSEHSKQIQRHKQIKENPETLFADNDHNTMSNLLFYTENTSLWHTAFCQHHYKKRHM